MRLSTPACSPSCLSFRQVLRSARQYSTSLLTHALHCRRHGRSGRLKIASEGRTSFLSYFMDMRCEVHSLRKFEWHGMCAHNLCGSVEREISQEVHDAGSEQLHATCREGTPTCHGTTCSVASQTQSTNTMLRAIPHTPIRYTAHTAALCTHSLVSGWG